MSKKLKAVENEEVEGNEVQAEAAPETISLAEICAEMGIKAQGARVKLRKKLTGAKGDGFRWVFPIEQKEEIVALLTPKAKEEGEADAGEDDQADGNDVEGEDQE